MVQAAARLAVAAADSINTQYGTTLELGNTIVALLQLTPCAALPTAHPAGALDALLAVKRVNMSEKGVQTCENVDDECEIFFD